MSCFRLLATLVAFLGFTLGAAAQDNQRMMLDTGGHMARVNVLKYTPDGKYVVTVSEDKSIRIWDVAAGRTVRIIRGESGDGPEGKVYGMALSPDGKIIAASGWLPDPQLRGGHYIRLHDFATGKLIGLLHGHTDVVSGLSFSPDGTKLLSGGSDNTAILWDVKTLKPIFKLTGHTDHIYGTGFTPDGKRLVTTGYDGTLRLWRASDGQLIKIMRGHTTRIRSLAIDPKNGVIASGDWVGEIKLWDGQSGNLIKTIGKQPRVIGSLAFSPDGTRLVSTNAEGDGPRVQRVWDVKQGIEVQSYVGHNNTVIASDFSPDGLYIATAGGNDRAIHIWDAKTGYKLRELKGVGEVAWSAGFSPDGKTLAWGLTNANMAGLTPINERGPFEYQLALPIGNQPMGRPERVNDKSPKFIRANAAKDGGWQLWAVKGGRYNHPGGGLEIRKDGKAQATIERGPSNGERHSAFTFTPDGKALITGGSWGVLQAYTLDGKLIGDYIGHEGDIWAVTPSPDGKYLASAAADQTVRLWNLQTRELIVTIFQALDGEWVMWTPQGYYTSSPNGDKYVGWQINRGIMKEADYVLAEQLRKHLYRPDIVERAIQVASANQAIADISRTGVVSRFTLRSLDKTLPPEFAIVSPPDGSKVAKGRAVLTLAVTQGRTEAIQEFTVYVNDSQVDAKPQRTATPDGEKVLLDIPLYQGKNAVRVVARNTANLLAEDRLSLIQSGEGALDRRGKLYVVAIGVDQYPNLPATCGDPPGPCNLTFAGADAKSFEQTIRQHLGPSHKDGVVSRVLFNGAGGNNEPTRANIEDALDTFVAAQDNDTVVLFIAGHGTNVDPRGYLFLPTDAKPGPTGWQSSNVVRWTTIEGAIQGARGRRLLFVDTCRAANAFNARLINENAKAQLVVYTATRKQQDAMELPKLGHGVFTHAIIRGLAGEAATKNDKIVQVQRLGQFVKDTVRDLTDGEQEPDYYKPLTTDDFILARY